jgi:hypothetical protein
MRFQFKRRALAFAAASDYRCRTPNLTRVNAQLSAS